MQKIVKQTVTLNASAKKLYAMYLNPKKHGAIVGGKVLVSAKRGAKFHAFGGALTGMTLYTVPSREVSRGC